MTVLRLVARHDLKEDEVAKRKSQSPEYLENIELYKASRHNTLTFEGKSYEKGDEVYVLLPNRVESIRSTFIAYVTPPRGRAYVEVITRKGINRVIRPENITKGGRKI